MNSVLLVVVLGFGAWGAPASALPLHEGKSPLEAEGGHAAAAKHAELSFWSRSSERAGKRPKTDAGRSRWSEEVHGRPTGRGDATPTVPAVPEPSALILFGVGWLVASRALTRRQS